MDLMGGLHAPIGLSLGQALAKKTTDSAFARLPQAKDVLADDLLPPLLRMDAAGRSHQTATLSYLIVVRVKTMYASIASRLLPDATISICIRDGVVEVSMACTEARWHFCNDLGATQPRQQPIKMLASLLRAHSDQAIRFKYHIIIGHTGVQRFFGSKQ